MAIFDTLLLVLTARFPDVGLRVERGERPRAIIPALHPDVGEIILQDDGDEITAFVGNFTHTHFSNYQDIPVAEKEKIIAEDVVRFLDNLFADRIVMWGSHRGMGGWHAIDSPSLVSFGRKKYVWSGPQRI